MVLERYRKEFDESLGPVARTFHRAGITPNVISVVSLLFAFVAALFFYLSSGVRPDWLLAAAVAVSINAILDAVDGKLARATGQASERGDYLDHVIDRYADLAILIGITLSPWADVRWGILAIGGTFLTSYMGTQAQALGLGRNYAGLLGRADRLVLLVATPVVQYVGATGLVPIPATVLGVTWLTALLGYFAVVGNLTALQRFWFGWVELGKREKKA